MAEEKPHKAEKKRIRWTVGGNRIEYEGKVSTPTADLPTVKLLLNSVLSTTGAAIMTADIKDFYLNTPMTHYEYMNIPVKDIHDEIMKQYNLKAKIINKQVLVEIRKGMYRLPQAGILANERLVGHLARSGYIQTRHTPGLFTHTTRPIAFTLVVDDFGINYVEKEHATHLLDCLKSQYVITEDWTGSVYCGLTLQWNYTLRTVDVSMPGYIAKALTRFGITNPTRPQHSPHAWLAPAFGASVQLAPLRAPSTVVLNYRLFTRPGILPLHLPLSCTSPKSCRKFWLMLPKWSSQ